MSFTDRLAGLFRRRDDDAGAKRRRIRAGRRRNRAGLSHYQSMLDREATPADLEQLRGFVRTRLRRSLIEEGYAVDVAVDGGGGTPDPFAVGGDGECGDVRRGGLGLHVEVDPHGYSESMRRYRPTAMTTQNGRERKTRPRSRQRVCVFDDGVLARDAVFQQCKPRLFYLHFWAVDDAVGLAKTLRPALDPTNLQPT